MPILTLQWEVAHGSSHGGEVGAVGEVDAAEFGEGRDGLGERDQNLVLYTQVLLSPQSFSVETLK